MVAPARQRGPVTSTVTRDAWDEAQMELAVRRQEALEHVARLAPLHQRLYGVSTFVGPQAEQLVAAAMHECERYRLRNEQ